MKVYLTQSSKTGGKFWEIETKGRKYYIRFGKIGFDGRKMDKSFGSKEECEDEAKEEIRKKKNKGYSKPSKKRKNISSDDDDDNDDDDDDDDDYNDEPPKKKRKTSDNKNEKILRELLRESSVLLQDEDENLKIEVVVNDKNKSYSMVKGKIGTKGRKQTKKFNSKKKAFDAALNVLVSKMRDGYTIVESSDDEESDSESSHSHNHDDDIDHGIDDRVFAKYSFCISGGFSMTQSEIKKLIKDHGGQYKVKPNKDTDFVVVKTVNPNLESTKCDIAQKLKIPIITKDFLTDSIKKDKLLNYEDYIAQTNDDNDDDNDDDDDMDVDDKDDDVDDDDDDDNDDDDDVRKKKSYKRLKMVGSAPVDEHCEENGVIVFEENGVVYDAMLNQTNIGNNNNKFYKLQVLKRESSDEYFHYFRWARVGYKGQIRCVEGSKESAIQAFKDKFYDKTLNDWEDRNNFESHAKKYTYLKMDYSGNNNNDNNNNDGDDPWNDDEDETKIQSKLDKDIQDLVQLIFDKNMMESQMKEIGYDAEKLPLGKVDKSIISEAYQILKDIESALNNADIDSDDDDNDDNDDDDDSNNNNNTRRRGKRSRKSRKSSRKVYSAEITELSSRYYTLIPHEFGFKKPTAISSEKLLNREMKLIEALSEIEVASRLLAGDKKGKHDKHPIDKHFDLLKCEIESIPKSDDEWDMLSNYVQLTHASTHNRYKLSVEKIYKLGRDGSDDRFNPWSKNTNRMLLWHGSRLTNFVGIISQGLRIAPPEAPVTGYMFGKGVYFADMCSKSANYCFTSPTNNTGLILLCEVALGEMNKLLHSDYYAANLPNGCSSTKGCGKTTPDTKTYAKLKNGCIVPSGKGIKDNKLKSSLLYNEYIVYDTAQIKMKYLLKLKFNYHDLY